MDKMDAQTEAIYNLMQADRMQYLTDEDLEEARALGLCPDTLYNVLHKRLERRSS